MNSKSKMPLLKWVVIAAIPVFLAGCGLLGIGGKGKGTASQPGQVIGAEERPGFVMTIPYGMITVPAGTFHMGQADEDPASTQVNYNKQITIGPFYMDDTEITNNEYRQFTDFFRSPSSLNTPWKDDFEDSTKRPLKTNAAITQMLGDPAQFKKLYYPDSTVWVKDFVHHMGEPIQDYYFMHPGYDEFPVVGVNWNAAVFFAKWRTAYWNDYRMSIGEAPMPSFRLPSEAEWEYAARGGRDMAKYPWGNPYTRNSKGCVLANFKPGRGNYYDDGFSYTAPVMQFFPNDYGLWDMAGNVAEWCLDDYNPSAVPTVWDLNPQYIEKNPKPWQQKVVRGGSWKDVAYYLETGTRSHEYRDMTRAYIGFRCALTHLGRSSGYEFGKP